MILSNAKIRAFLSNPWSASVLLLIAVAVLGLTANRTYQQYSAPSLEFDWAHRGMSDFHNGTYFPTLAFANGDNPYAASVREKYPLARQSPVYSPIVFFIHLPLILFDVPTADGIFFVYTLGLLVVLASLPLWLCRPTGLNRTGYISLFLLLFLLLLISRPGHITLFTGYFTLELVLGTVLAIEFSQRSPGLSGIGVLLASGKPTYVIPLILLLLASRRFKAVFWGLSFSFVAGMAGLFWLASHSDWGSVIAGIREGQDALHADPTELPVNSWTRVDELALLGKLWNWAPGNAVYLVAMLIQIAVVTPWLWFANRANAAVDSRLSATNAQGLLVLLTMTISIYHHSYDTLLIAVPMFALLLSDSFFPNSNQVTTRLREVPVRWILFGLCSVPFWNLISTQGFRDKMGWENDAVIWQAVTMLNGICLAAAWLLLLYSILIANRSPKNSTAK